MKRITLAALFKWPRNRRSYPGYGPRSPWAAANRAHPLRPTFQRVLALHIYKTTMVTSLETPTFWRKWIGLEKMEGVVP